MKEQFGKLALMIAFALLALSLNVAAQDHKRTAQIDFDFTVGTQQLPAGEYTFQPLNKDNTSRLLVVKNNQTGAQAIICVTPDTHSSKALHGPLSFNKYGDQRYFAQVTLGQYTYTAVKSNDERQLAKQFVTEKRKGDNTASEVR